MKSGIVCINVVNATKQKVDYNKQFLTMVRVNVMLNDGGG